MHPDKGGDANKFQDLTKAHEILSDPQKRAAYDRLGEEGMKPGGVQDMFRDIPKDNGVAKTKSVVH